MSEEPLDRLVQAARELVEGPPGDGGECWYCGGALEPILGCPVHGPDAVCYGYMFDGDHDHDCQMVELRDALDALHES